MALHDREFPMRRGAVSTCALALVILLSGHVCLSKADSVAIYNGMGQPLTAHCSSRDDDLGVQTLQNARYYWITFSPAFFGNTLFACDFNSPGFIQQHVNVYMGWEYHRECTCSQCFWVVRRNGFYCNGDLKTIWPGMADHYAAGNETLQKGGETGN